MSSSPPMSLVPRMWLMLNSLLTPPAAPAPLWLSVFLDCEPVVLLAVASPTTNMAYANQENWLVHCIIIQVMHILEPMQNFKSRVRYINFKTKMLHFHIEQLKSFQNVCIINLQDRGITQTHVLIGFSDLLLAQWWFKWVKYILLHSPYINLQFDNPTNICYLANLKCSTLQPYLPN